MAYTPTTDAGRAMRVLVEETIAQVSDPRARMALDLAKPVLSRAYEAMDRDPALARERILHVVRSTAATLGLTAADIFPGDGMTSKGRGAA